MLTEKQLKIIASLYPSEAFDILKKIVEEEKDIIKSEPTKKESEFETIYKLGHSNGRLESLDWLLKRLENLYKKWSVLSQKKNS